MITCAVFQVAAPNVSVAGATVAASASLLAAVMLTLALGWLVSATRYVAVPPASATVSASGVIVTPATSLSVIVRFIVAVSDGLVLVASQIMISSSSTTSSSLMLRMVVADVRPWAMVRVGTDSM